MNGAHPGIIKNTELNRDARGALKLFGATLSRFTTPVANTPVWLATSSEVDGTNGRFFVNRKQVPTAPHTTDVHRCDRLWNEAPVWWDFLRIHERQ